MRSARRGSLIAATWLIGLGIVFLVRQAVELPWGQAWPMFVILAGVASVVSTAVAWPRGGGLWAFTWPVAWIVIGSLLLASTTGSLQAGPGELIATWWPWALVALGVWFLLGAVFAGRGGGSEMLAIPLESEGAAGIRIRFGAGRLTTGIAAPGHLVDGHVDGGADQHRLGPNRIELAQDVAFGVPWLERPTDWTIGLTGEVPLDLRVEMGASRALLDLDSLRVRSLEIRTGASETRIRLPRNAGATDVHAEAGAASVTFEVPAGVAARIRSRVALGSSQIDQARFPRTGDVYESADYGSVANRVDIDIAGGVGSVRVIGSD
jgi:hypothetical protein